MPKKEDKKEKSRGKKIAEASELLRIKTELLALKLRGDIDGRRRQ